MNPNKEDLEKLIDFIIELSELKENEWFKNKLIDKIEASSNIVSIKKNTDKIVNLLDVNPECSIDYSFISHQLLRKRLELDNLRMENVRYDIKEKEDIKRLYDFCINAFYQIENLLNYYYYEKYPKINDLFDHLEGIDKTKFKRKSEKNVGDITIAVKMYSFIRVYYSSPEEISIGYNLDNLRQIRNEGLHRCTRIKNIQNENLRLHQFIKYASFDSIHGLVNSLTEKIKKSFIK